MSAPAVKPTRRPQVRPRLRVALNALVYDGLTIGEAAQKAGMAYEAVRVALHRPHVQAALASVKRERLGLESLRSFHTVTDLRDNSASDKVRLDASKVIMTAAGDLEPEHNHAPTTALALQIIVSPQHALPVNFNAAGGVIEAPAFDPETFRARIMPAPDPALLAVDDDKD